MDSCYRIALAQMLVEGGRPEPNLERARMRIGEAAAAGCRLVVLPEAMDLGWTDPSARRLAEAVPGGRSWRLLSEEAKRRHIYVCSGLVEREENRLYNSAVLISPAGELLLKHRKINELDIAWELYDQGGWIQTCRTELGSIGIMICADGFVRERFIGRALGELGAQLILCPSAWAVGADHDQKTSPYGELWRRSFGPVAAEYATWIVAVSNVGPLTDGPWKGKRCIGCSLAFDADGNEVLYGPYAEEALLTVEIRTAPKSRTFSELRGD